MSTCHITALAFLLFDQKNQYLQQTIYHLDGLVQERHNFIANTLELHLSCTNPLILSLTCPC